MNNNENPNFSVNLVNPLENNLDNTQPVVQTTVPPTEPSVEVPVLTETPTEELQMTETVPTPVVEETETLEPAVEVPATNASVTEAPTTDAPSTVAPAPFSPTTKAPTTVGQTRYNPVTGEEMDVKELTGTKEEVVENTEVNNEEKLKTVDIEYKPNSTANTVMLIIFFIALILFVVFLPDIQSLIAQYKAGPQQIEDITTGKLVCTLETSTVNLDREITRVFEYADKKLQSAKFTTIVRGDATLDEETLNELNAQCEQIKDNVDGLEGVSVSCSYENGKLTEKESFDYASYNVEDVDAAYAEAGGSVLEFEYEADIDTVMTNMRQGGFTCNKEK